MIRFLWEKKFSASEIYSQILEVYGKEAMSKQHVEIWCRSFKADREDVENHNSAASGRLSSAMTEINTDQIKEMIQNEQRVQ